MKLTPFQLARDLFLFTTAVLVVFGIATLFRISVNPDNAGLYMFYSSLLFLDAAFMAVCALQLHKGTKFIFFFSIFVLAMNIVPTIFDQFGLPDLLFVMLNIATLVTLILARKEFLPA